MHRPTSDPNTPKLSCADNSVLSASGTYPNPDFAPTQTSAQDPRFSRLHTTDLILTSGSATLRRGLRVSSLEERLATGRLPGEGMRVCRHPFAFKQEVGPSGPDRYCLVELSEISLHPAWQPLARCLTRFMWAKVVQTPPQRWLQTRLAPWKDMKALEPSVANPDVTGRCMVRSGTAGAGSQRAKPAYKQKDEGGCRRASWRPTVEL